MYSIYSGIIQLYMMAVSLFLFSLIPLPPLEDSNNSRNFCILYPSHPDSPYLFLTCTIARNDLSHLE